MFTFQFLNDKIYNYVIFDIIANFIIQKLKSKHTFLKEYTNQAKLTAIFFSGFEGTRGEKTQIFRTLNNWIPRVEVILRPRKVMLAFLVWTSYSLNSWSDIDFNACGKDQSKFFRLLSMLFPPKEIIDIKSDNL